MWISSIVPVRKKNGQIRVCVDFRDLNITFPKDDFPLSIAELIIDATTGHEALSFMDGLSRYNQIRMGPVDEELTAFRTPKGIYCYKVMSFGLKNVGATYQRAMQKIFDDMLHKNIECYVDDLVVKSNKRENHFHDLRKVFESLRRYQLKMSHSKCAFGVISGKFLGFIVRQRGIEIEQAKIDSQKFARKASISPEVYFKSSRSLSTIESSDEERRTLYRNHSLSENDEGKENALYYLNMTITPNELKHSPIEKLCLALIFSIQKLKHYFQSRSIHLVSKANPLKYVMAKPVLSDRLARCYASLKMYFDGSSHKEGAGAGVVFVTSEGEVLHYSFTLTQNCSNNVAEYQALILGLEIAIDAKQLPLKVYGNSQLLVNQLLSLYEVKKPELLPYHNYAKRLMGWPGDVELEHLPRKDNKQADALAKLASTLSMIDKETCIPICKSWVIPPIFSNDEDDMFQEEKNHVTEVFEVEEED
ncbi:hypothetical protein Sango_1237100 [Sesamum angolense]|uniref:RNase H type-1 domain-containing protein n=1 Tax=Sesamum angolense TaxID=2727404 RepID=A0AAE1WQ88_9LAMI|nr:hypothetical protein Sango_1237100 [Sesamum angolense]